ncbi:membrane bound O-acyl transferase family-domain-containing protein [Crassisporium funariophilum]|nr:membrane bound O-acyl transferase family-domain-containing protein [Crassisporium funariophilum]
MELEKLLQTHFVHCLFFAIFFVAGLACKPSPQRKLFFPCLLAVYTAILVYTPRVRLSIGAEYQIGLTTSIWLAYALNLVILSEPQVTLRRKGQTQPAHQLSGFRRVGWAINLINNQRGVNWSCEVPNLRRSPLPRWAFVGSQLRWAVTFYCINDLLSFLAKTNPAFHMGGKRMGDGGYLWQAWNVALCWSTIATYMQLNHALGSAFAVTSGLSDPSDWPAWFGPLKETASIRKFWGQTWHQAIRRAVSTPGKFIARDCLQFSAGTLLSSYTQLYIAFFLSGAFHGAADWIVVRNSATFNRNIAFYTVQALAITLEDMIIYVGKRFNIGRLPLLPYMWVAIWMTWSSPIWLETLIEGGMGDFGPPVSFMSYITEKYALR